MDFTDKRKETKIKIKNPNTIKINVTGKGYITEINTKDNLENPKTIKKLEKNINKSIKKNLKQAIKKMQKKYHSDVFGFGNKIYKKYPKEFKKISKNWNDNHFKKLKTNINVSIKINSSGSLDRTIKEVDK